MTLKEIVNIQFENRSEGLACLSHRSQVNFAIYCSKLVTHLDTTTEGPIAIATATKWLNGEATANDCKKAAYAAANATSTANAYAAAYATYAAAYAAYAANANANANAAYAAYDAAYANAAANAAAEAASSVASASVSSATLYKYKMIKQLQILLLQEHHKDLKLNKLHLRLWGVTK